MHLENIAIFVLGLLLGYLAWHLVMRNARGQLTVDGFIAVLAVFAGGGLIKLFRDFLRSFNDVWWYPLGLGCGVLLYMILSLLNGLTSGGETAAGDAGQVFPNAFGLFKRSRRT
jgi:hypothetical protein